MPTAVHPAAIFLDAFEARLEEVNVRYGTACWELYTQGSAPDLVAAQEAIRDLYAESGLAQSLATLTATPPDDPLLARRLKLVAASHLSARLSAQPEIYELENALADRLNTYRATFEGRRSSNVELTQVLRTDSDRGRREGAWRAMAAAGPLLKDDLWELFRRRDRLARGMNYAGFRPLALHLADVSEPLLDRICAELEALVAPRREELRALFASRLGFDGPLEPWDASYIFREELIATQRFYREDQLWERLDSTFRGFGVDLARLPIIADREPREGKSQHAYSFNIRPPHDVRVLVNMEPGIDFARTLFHEYGHAIHAAQVDQPTFILRESPSGAFAEGLAEVTSGIVQFPAFMRDVAHVPDDWIARWQIVRKIRAAQNVESMLTYIEFEREVYRDPSRDPHALYLAAEARHSLFASHPEVPAWARVIHFSTHPVYLQNYLLASLVQYQTYAALEREFGVDWWRDARTGDWLRENYYAPGARYDWLELVERATGEPLTARHFVDANLS